MSQHIFPAKHKETPVNVYAGWDRPLQQYFMVIALSDPDDDLTDEEVYIYSNLFDQTSEKKDIDYYVAKLKDFGIDIPKSILDDIRLDCTQNMGNKVCFYDEHGVLKEPQRCEE